MQELALGGKLNVEGLPAGVYQLAIAGADGVQMARFIKH